MPALPRLVVASVSENDEPSLNTLAILAALRKRGYEVQHFRSLAAFTPVDHVTPLTGISSRHLDPWIMTPELCRELFAHSASTADMSVIEGCPCGDLEGTGHAIRWREVAQILNAPVIGVVRSQPKDCFHAPPLSPGIDALLIDGFTSREHYRHEKAALEGMSGLPVLGGFAAPKDRSAPISRKVVFGKRVSGSLIDSVIQGMNEVTDFDRLIDLAESRPFPNEASGLFAERAERRSLRVAIAYDRCFNCYFPDTLDALEYLGAEICEFSPLESEDLPADTDIVYLGCGHPEQFAQQLAENECMRAALRRHVCAGHRVYAEGGATAYLCQHLRLGDRVVPMAGVFAADAEWTGEPFARPQPAELVARRSTWLSREDDTIRGYASGAWRIIPREGLVAAFDSPSFLWCGLVRHHCIGSTAHLNFAAQPRVLQSFFAPHAPSLTI